MLPALTLSALLLIAGYVATYFYADEAGNDTGAIRLRSVDVFRRDAGRWLQSASHTAVIPSGGKWGEGKQE